MTPDTVPQTLPAELQVIAGFRDVEAWDTFVRADPGASFCHLSGWRRVVEDVLGRDYIPMAAVYGGGRLAGVLPLVRMRTLFLGHSLISMPFVNYGGPSGAPKAVEALTAAAVAEAERSGAGLLQLRCREPVHSELPRNDRKVLVLLDLPADEDTLWKGFSSKLRSQVRRPMKEGMVFSTGPEHLDAFYGVFARNMRDLGTPVYSRKFFEAIREGFGGDVVFATVELDGRAVAAACGFVWRHEFEITWASAVRDYNRLAPNMLLYWGLMREMISRGVGVFNFGRSTPGASTHRFKTQWGGRDVPLPWLEWATRPGTGDGGPSSLARLASRAWQHLPLRVAGMLGPPVAARLPWW
jgi:serine/alanine adding enzyme